MVKYLRREEVFGRIFSGYFQIAGNPQQEHRASAVKGIFKALQELGEMGVSFDELASQKAYRKLTMATDTGMDNFVNFIHDLIKTGDAPQVEMRDVSNEKQHIESWARAHAAELAAVGAQEKWQSARFAKAARRLRAMQRQWL